MDTVDDINPTDGEIPKPIYSAQESHFVEFFFDVIPVIYNLKDRDFLHNVGVALYNLRKVKTILPTKYSKLPVSEVDFHEAYFRCAYMFAYGSLHAATVHHRFVKFLKRNAELRRGILLKETINICCLGGGPGTEAIAICKIINDLIKLLKPESMNSKCENGDQQRTFKVNVTVIDICKEWKTDADIIFSTLNKSRILDSGRLEIFTHFIQADLLQRLSTDVKQNIKSSDVITMVKFGSYIKESASNKVCRLEKMMLNVIRCMMEGSCLFLLESSGGSVFVKLMDAMIRFPNDVKLKASVHKSCGISENSSLLLQALFRQPISRTRLRISPTVMTSVSSCLWVKKKRQYPKKKR